MLGEDHPVAMIWTQRERQLLDVANEVLRLSYIILGYSEGTTEAEVATADSMQPAKVQVKVCSVKVNDAAHNLPVGEVASGGITGGAHTAFRPQNAPAEGGQQCEEAQPVAGLQAADATQLANQVHVSTTIEASCASPHSPVGKMASGGHPAPVEVAPRLQTAAEVAQFGYMTAGTTPPAAEQVATTTVG